MRTLTVLFVLAGLLSACGGSAAENTTDVDNPEKGADAMAAKVDLLQGKWVSAADPNVSWTFTNGQLTEGLKGEQDRSQSGTYTLSDDCLNGDGSGATSPNNYLNLVNPDRCFFIVGLSEKELTLSYVGRGNTLRFIK